MIAEKFDRIRSTHFYKTLTLYIATAYVEGILEGENASHEERIIAWQYLIDTGQVCCLQGWFGRSATSLIKTGICEKAKK